MFCRTRKRSRIYFILGIPSATSTHKVSVGYGDHETTDSQTNMRAVPLPVPMNLSLCNTFRYLYILTYTYIHAYIYIYLEGIAEIYGTHEKFHNVT